ncbi:MAG: LPS export ABC transporter periplasmic protein LptC [Alistipes sp.]|nr:LPS export ABC transporter periplasmic protein LptC [Alistipes sp.]
MESRHRQITKYIRSALLVAGSAFYICGCRSTPVDDGETSEGLMTQEAFNLVRIESENGKLSNRFETPLMEVYEYAREPYREFRKGIDITTYSSETGEVESTLVADYAIEFINQQLWEAKGNVVATNAKGHILETQQLFWNQRTGRIYSNIDTKITQGSDIIIGVGFESDEQFRDWEFRRPRGTVDVDVEATKTPGAGTPEDPAPVGSEAAEEGSREDATEPSLQPEPEAAPAPSQAAGQPDTREAGARPQAAPANGAARPLRRERAVMEPLERAPVEQNAD